MFKNALLTALLVLVLAVPAAAQKVISFGTDATWPPMEFLNEDKQIVGFSIDLLKAMGKAGGFTPEIQNVAWDGIFAGVMAGKYDAVNSSVSITEKRKKAMDFSDPYFEVKQAVIVSEKAAIGSAADLSGKKVGAQIGTTGFFAAKKIDGAEAKSYDEVGLAVADLANGNLDAVICDDAVALDYALTNPEYAKTLKVAYMITPDEPEYLGWPVKKGNTEIIEALNAALAKVKASGEYDRIYAKWFDSK